MSDMQKYIIYTTTARKLHVLPPHSVYFIPTCVFPFKHVFFILVPILV